MFDMTEGLSGIALFGESGPADSVRDLPVSSMLRDGDGHRPTRTRRERGARTTRRRAAIGESLRAR